MDMTCGWCGGVIPENEQKMSLLIEGVFAVVCIECALEWIMEHQTEKGSGDEV